VEQQNSELSREQRVLRMVRRTLGAIARETAPQDGGEHPLTQQTFEDMRDCFGLIAERERELAAATGVDISTMRPKFIDEDTNSPQFVPVDSIKKSVG